MNFSRGRRNLTSLHLRAVLRRWSGDIFYGRSPPHPPGQIVAISVLDFHFAIYTHGQFTLFLLSLCIAAAVPQE